MNRRHFIRNTVLLGAGAAAGGCGGSGGPAGPERPRERVQPLRVGLYGDSHAGYPGSTFSPPADPIHRAIVDHLLEFNPSLVFNLGDHIHHTGSQQWQVFDSITANLRACCRYYPVVGNHDTGDGGMAAYHAVFADAVPADRTWYHVRHPLALFCILDVHSSPVSDLETQQKWVEQTLKAHTDAAFRFVLFHVPPWTTAGRGPFAYARAFNSICQDCGVDMVFNGHIHAYERFLINGIHYVVSGGAGGFGCGRELRGAHCLDANTDATYLEPMRRADAETNHYLTMELSESACTLTARDLSGGTIDTLSIAPRAGVPAMRR